MKRINKYILTGDGAYIRIGTLHIRFVGYLYIIRSKHTVVMDDFSIRVIIYTSRNYFKLRDLSLSYQMPKSVCDKLHMKGLTLAFVGQNLFVWTKEFRFTDPDSDSDNLSSPSTRYLGFNVKLDF